MTKSEAKTVYEEPSFVIDDFSLSLFSLEEHRWMINYTVSEWIGTVAAKYGCKILQQYEYEANEYGYEATRKTEDYRVEIFLHCLDSTCSKIKLITINIIFYENKTIGCTQYGYFVAGYITLYIGFCNRLCHRPFQQSKEYNNCTG